MNKLVVIVGPTASGKSDLAVDIAKKIDGEIVSADSRQVYKGLDIGSGKITKREMRGVPHHLLDVASPKRVFSVFEYKKEAEKALEKIWKKEKPAILVGGTGQYIESIVDGITFPEVPPNQELRSKLENLSLSKLQAKLKKLDPKRYKQIDKYNKVRLIRSIEIAKTLGKVPKIKKKERNFDLIMIGLKTPKEELAEKINKRIHKRMRQGMVSEVKKLHEKGLSWKRMEALGLEYRYISRYLRGLISKESMLEELEIEIRKYAKRQMTWFQRDKRIKWLNINTQKSAIMKEIEHFKRR